MSIFFEIKISIIKYFQTQLNDFEYVQWLNENPLLIISFFSLLSHHFFCRIPKLEISDVHHLNLVITFFSVSFSLM